MRTDSSFSNLLRIFSILPDNSPPLCCSVILLLLSCSSHLKDGKRFPCLDLQFIFLSQASQARRSFYQRLQEPGVTGLSFSMFITVSHMARDKRLTNDTAIGKMKRGG